MTQPTRVVCTPDQLGSGITVLSNTSNEIVRKKGLLPGRIGVLVLGPNCKPLPNAPFRLSEGGAVIKTGSTSAKGIVELELPIDMYKLEVHGESFDVISQEKGSKTVQVFQLQGTIPGIFDTRIPARPSGPLMGGREWLRWLSDPTTTKWVPFGDDKNYNPLGVPRTATVDVFRQENGEIREHVALAEFRKGNMPAFCRIFKPLKLHHSNIGEATVFVTCDHLAIGSDHDYIRFPLGGFGAQTLANEWNCHLPTFKIVVECLLKADHKLIGHGLPLDNTIHQRANRAFMVHEDIIQGRHFCDAATLDKVVYTPTLPFKLYSATHNGKCQLPPGVHPGELVCGHKKEVIISIQQGTAAGRGQGQAAWGPGGGLSMFGLWNEGRMGATDALGRKLPIVWQDFRQALFAKHAANYADYSHGVRLVHPRVELKLKGAANVENVAYTAILADKKLEPLFTQLEGSDWDSNGGVWDRFGYDIPLPGTWR